MLQILVTTQKNIIAVRANDILRKSDYEKVHQLIHKIIRTGKKERWYFDVDDCLISNTVGFWEDVII